VQPLCFLRRRIVGSDAVESGHAALRTRRGRSEAVTKLGDGVSVSLCPSYALSFNQAVNSAPHLITDGPHLVPG
jgi:hypothetical protein